MDILSYLSELIQTRKSVGISGLGTVYKKKSPGRYDAETHSFIPPSYTLDFTAELKENALLADYISKKRNVSADTANYYINEYSTAVQQQLNDHKEATLGALGKLFKEGEQLRFEPAEKLSYGFDFFGLPPVKAEQENPVKEIIIETPNVEEPDTVTETAPAKQETPEIETAESEYIEPVSAEITIEDSVKKDLINGDPVTETSATADTGADDKKANTPDETALKESEAVAQEETIKENAAVNENSGVTEIEVATEKATAETAQNNTTQNNTTQNNTTQSNTTQSNITEDKTPEETETPEILPGTESVQSKVESAESSITNTPQSEPTPVTPEAHVTSETPVTPEIPAENTSAETKQAQENNRQDVRNDEQKLRAEIEALNFYRSQSPVSKPAVNESEEVIWHIKDTIPTVTTPPKPPVNEPAEVYHPEEEVKKRSPYLVIIIIIVVSALLVVGAYLLKPEWFSQFTGKPAALPKTEAPVTAPVVSNTPADSAALKKDTLKTATPNTAASKPVLKDSAAKTTVIAPKDTSVVYEIIGASMHDQKEADNFIAQMKKSGITAKVVTNMAGKRLKMSIATLKDEQSAKLELEKLSQKLKIPGIYIYRNKQ